MFIMYSDCASYTLTVPHVQYLYFIKGACAPCAVLDLRVHDLCFNYSARAWFTVPNLHVHYLCSIYYVCT